MTIIERARALVAERPAAFEGQNGNATTFGVASVLVWGFGLAPAEALPVMLEYNTRCEPPWSERDLVRMLNSVLNRTHDKARGYLVGDGVKGGTELATAAAEAPKRKRSRKLELEKLKAAQDPALKMDMSQWTLWLRARSIVEPRSVTPTQYLDSLYQPGEKIIVFNKMWGTQGDFGRVIGDKTWSLCQNPHDRPFVVESLPDGSPEGMQFAMQPMDGKWHIKPRTTELSRRTKQSVTRWPYILLESDNAPLEMWLNAIVRAKIRIVSITASGGRSLHALVRLDKETEDDLLAEFENGNARETLSVLGCDFQAMVSLVYPRLPNTWRDGKRVGKYDAAGNPLYDDRKRRVMHFVPFQYGRTKQTLLYYNPAAERGCSIAEGLIIERGA